MVKFGSVVKEALTTWLIYILVVGSIGLIAILVSGMLIDKLSLSQITTPFFNQNFVMEILSQLGFILATFFIAIYIKQLLYPKNEAKQDSYKPSDLGQSTFLRDEPANVDSQKVNYVPAPHLDDQPPMPPLPPQQDTGVLDDHALPPPPPMPAGRNPFEPTNQGGF